MIDLRLGDWREILADVESCDVLMTDSPYSDRTHRGERGLRDAPYASTAQGHPVARPQHLPRNSIGYGAITENDALDLAKAWAWRTKEWAIIFADHISFRWHEAAWAAQAWYTFAPVIWYRRDAAPRFSGDGPGQCVDYILVARPKKRVRDPGHRPGLYPVLGQCGRNGGASGVVGQKDLNGMRALTRDYTRPGDLIVDPFAGSGTTLVAAALEARNAIGAEVDPVTHDIAAGRLAAPRTYDLFAGASGV